MSTTIDWMENQIQTSKGRFAVIGNSRGRETALLLAIQYSKIATVISIVPSAYVVGAYDNKRRVSRSAWTPDGKETPVLTIKRLLLTINPWWKIIEHKEEVEPFAVPIISAI